LISLASRKTNKKNSSWLTTKPVIIFLKKSAKANNVRFLDQIYSPNAYVRDFYFFKRSQYPQLQLVHMEPDEAYNALQKQAFILKYVEIGKVMLTWAILKNVDMVCKQIKNNYH